MRKLFIALSFFSLSFAGSVTTANYNIQRTASNTSETILQQNNVGRLTLQGSYTVDDYVYAQPLVISNVAGVANALLTVTLNNSVYLFDADKPGTAALWSKNLGATRTTTDIDLYNKNVGCVSTPVVDTGTNVAYISCTFSGPSWKLFALNLADGSDFHAAVTISGTAQGFTFSANLHLQRPGLALSAGKVLIAFGSYADTGAFQGWLMSYDATTLAQSAIWCTVTSPGVEAGIWMGGGAPAIDGSGNIYVMVGNGTWDGTANFGESFVKLNASLVVQDYLTPSTWNADNGSDVDTGSGYPMIVSSFVMGGGKSGIWFVLNQAAMGGLEGGGGPPIAQSWLAAVRIGLFSGQCFANNTLFVGGRDDKIKSYAWNGSTFNTTPTNQSATTFSFPGAILAYTSNGSTAGTGVLWAVTDAASSGHAAQNGTLRAFNADTLVELYNSGTVGGDALGLISKFAEPTVVNGKVYVGTFSNKIQVYGVPTFPSVVGATTLLGNTKILH